MEEADVDLEIESMVIPEYMKLIQELTPKLNKTQRRLIESTLNNLGVKNIDDLSVIEPTDLSEAMTVVQARKLCLAIKARQEQMKGSSNSAESGESLFNSFSSPIETSTPDSPSPIPQSSSSSDSSIYCSQKTTTTADNPQSNWLMAYDIPYNKFSNKMTESLNKGVRPSDVDRREMVRILVDDIQRFCRKPSSTDLAAIAMKIVKKHQASLCDLLNGKVLGQGHTSLYHQLREKVNNNNRKRHSDVSDTDSPSVTKKSTTLYVKYGCIEWQSVSDKDKEQIKYKKDLMKIEISKTKQNTELIDTLMDETYSDQREIINKSLPVSKIKAEYPYLFKKRYALLHFKRLTGQDMEENYIMLSKKIKETLLNHFKSLKSHGPIKNLIENLQSEEEMQGSSCFMKAIPMFLMMYFEETDLIQVFQETSDIKFIEKEIKGQSEKAPVICVVGRLQSSQIFHIFCEDILLTTLSNLDDAVMVCFSLYYILNLRYHTKGSITLEFIQRVLVGINPVQGTKSSKLKGKRSQVHPKVLSLSNKLN